MLSRNSKKKTFSHRGEDSSTWKTLITALAASGATLALSAAPAHAESSRHQQTR